MSFLSPLKAAVKAIPFPAGHQWSPWGWQWDNRSSDLYRRSNINYVTEVGELTDSSAVMACMNWIIRVWPESPLAVYQTDADGEQNLVPDHPLTELLEQPNPDYGSAALWMGTLLSLNLDGNAYWVKVRNGFGGPAALYYIPHFMIQPRWPQDGSAFISHYEYSVEGRITRFAREDVVHFRFGTDPRNMRLGLSPLRSVLREVFTDNEAALYSAALVRNMGAVPVVISPDPTVFKEAAAVIGRERAEEMKEQWLRRSTGDERGKPLVQSVPVKLQGGQDFVFSPEQMAVRELRKIPEERISAALGIPAGVAGLGAGLDRNTYSNFKEAREMAYESNIIPTQHLIASELDRSLLPDFTNDRAFLCGFDISKVRVLAEDIDKIATRVVALFEKEVITRAEGRQMLGLKSTPEDEVYFGEVQMEKAAQVAELTAERDEDDEQGGGAEQNGRNGSEPAVRSLDFRFSVEGGPEFTRNRGRILQECLAAARKAGRQADGAGPHGCREADPPANGGPPAAHGGNGARGAGTNGT